MPTAAPDLHPHNRLAGSNGRDPTSWWRTAVIYQICVRSFADGNNDGVGDITGIRSRLPYLAELGVDAIWITPWYPSPMKDGGYDISDYRDIDPAFGTLADADERFALAHQLGIRVILDLVANDTSDQHPLFQAALAAAPGSPERATQCGLSVHSLDANSAPGP